MDADSDRLRVSVCLGYDCAYPADPRSVWPPPGRVPARGDGGVVHLALHRVQVPGVPDDLVLRPGDRCALIVSDRGQARRLADAIAGLDDPSAGPVVSGDGGVRRVRAEGGLLPYLIVLENLVHGNRVSRKVPVPRRTAVDECRDTASWFGLDDVLKRYPYEITPGRRRLAGLARALR